MDHQLCFREKLLWTKFLSGIHQKSANQSFEFMRPVLSLFNVSRHANMIVDKMGVSFRYAKIQG